MEWNQITLTNAFPITVKQRSNRRSIQTSIRRDTDPGTRNLNSTAWFEQNLAGALYPGGPSLAPDFADLGGQFPGIEDSGTVAGFNGWDTNVQPFSPTSLNSMAVPSAADAAPMSTAPSTVDSREDSEDFDDDKEPPDALSSQLMSLSQRTTRTMRRLVRPGRAPLTVSSPEVNEALEDTNTLTRIINNITAPERDESTIDSTTTDRGLAFSALACHQQLIALFRCICQAIHRCLQSKKEQHQQQPRNRQHNDVGASSVAQFVMVLQLLNHLINRMDRSLFQNNPSMWPRTGLTNSGYVTPVTPSMGNSHTLDSLQLETPSGAPSSSPGGLLVFVQDIVGTIPNEHEKLRQDIQKLQTEIEESELH